MKYIRLFEKYEEYDHDELIRLLSDASKLDFKEYNEKIKEIQKKFPMVLNKNSEYGKIWTKFMVIWHDKLKKEPDYVPPENPYAFMKRARTYSNALNKSIDKDKRYDVDLNDIRKRLEDEGKDTSEIDDLKNYKYEEPIVEPPQWFKDKQNKRYPFNERIKSFKNFNYEN